MSDHRDDDVPAHDAWLREALRHAPDADALPSAKLDAAVLRMGRAAVAPRVTREAPPPGLFDRLGAAWSWLARPPVAAGFASVMVAGVVGLMWWERPLEEALPPRVAPESVVSTAETAAAPVVAQVPAPAQPPAPAVAPPAGVQTRKASPPPPAERARDSVAAKSADAGAAAPAAPPPQAATGLTAETERRALASAAPVRREAEAAAARGPAPATAAAPAAPLADEPAAFAQRGAAAASAIETPGLSNLRFEIRARPERWTWQRDAGEPRPVDEAMQAWIAQVDRSARPAWQNAPAGDGTGAEVTLRFLRDGQPRALLRLRTNGLRLDRSGKAEVAELRGGQTAALRSQLDALGP